MQDKVNSVADRLVTKSIEAFILALEIYNKPTIRYRTEGFAFFICNAWELMLKAYIIKTKGEDAVYYKNSEDRTLSLRDCIATVFTNEKGNLRINLENILRLRDTSTHFVTEEYETIYAPLFQACVMNLAAKIKEFHNVDITRHIAQNFLTLNINVDLPTPEGIRSKYSAKTAEKLLREQSFINETINGKNPQYAIPVYTKFYITKNHLESDLEIALSKNSSTSAAIIRDVKDPNNLYPYTQGNIISLVNRKLKPQNILLTKVTGDKLCERPFNKYDFGLFAKFYGLKSDPVYCYYHEMSNRYCYSNKIVEFLFNQIVKDPEGIINKLEKEIKKR